MAIGNWEGDRGVMEEAKQILNIPVENRRRIEDGRPNAAGGRIQAASVETRRMHQSDEDEREW